MFEAFNIIVRLFNSGAWKTDSVLVQVAISHFNRTGNINEQSRKYVINEYNRSLAYPAAIHAVAANDALWGGRCGNR